MAISNKQSQTAESIQSWLINEFAERLELSQDEIDVNEPFDNYDLTSAETMILLGKLEKWLGIKLNPTLIFNYPTIAELGDRLAE
ncbi:acyl carrier protein [Scytonema sp. UIC 10036]|uniref:acyl carrier protein n=1 Tax=Scytonema sp. UIC 10036 TaxID=2304196 RepID=UPI0012DA7864|nr:acyl carrier protein [Scytonema sp. UIC 10036]MUH01817.1 acyl carrier protein [Scytonema sp. UIC 10036]